MLAVLLASWLAQVPAPPADPGFTSDHRLQLELGFSHWFGTTFGSPAGIGTPMILIGARPGLPFLELRARAAFSFAALGDHGQVGFVGLDAVAFRELRSEGQTLIAFAGPFAARLFSAEGAGEGLGLVLGVEYLFRVTRLVRHSVGIFMAARGLDYRLAGDPCGLFACPRHDAQIDIGIASTLF